MKTENENTVSDINEMSNLQVIEELQSVITRINNIQYTQSMCMSTRKSGDWQETIITGFQDPDTIVINIFTQLEGQL